MTRNDTRAPRFASCRFNAETRFEWIETAGDSIIFSYIKFSKKKIVRTFLLHDIIIINWYNLSLVIYLSQKKIWSIQVSTKRKKRKDYCIIYQTIIRNLCTELILYRSKFARFIFTLLLLREESFFFRWLCPFDDASLKFARDRMYQCKRKTGDLGPFFVWLYVAIRFGLVVVCGGCWKDF